MAAVRRDVRLAVAHPERVRAIVVPERGRARGWTVRQAWEIHRAFWKDRAAYEEKVIPGLGVTGRRNGSGVWAARRRIRDRYDPETWEWEAALFSRLGQHRQIQSDLFFDYRTNVADYPSWQAWLRDRSGRRCLCFGAAMILPSPSPKLMPTSRTFPESAVYILDAGHFALDKKLISRPC